MDAEPSGHGSPEAEMSRRLFLATMTKGMAGISASGALLAACTT